MERLFLNTADIDFTTGSAPGPPFWESRTSNTAKDRKSQYATALLTHQGEVEGNEEVSRYWCAIGCSSPTDIHIIDIIPKQITALPETPLVLLSRLYDQSSWYMIHQNAWPIFQPPHECIWRLSILVVCDDWNTLNYESLRPVWKITITIVVFEKEGSIYNRGVW